MIEKINFLFNSISAKVTTFIILFSSFIIVAVFLTIYNFSNSRLENTAKEETLLRVNNVINKIEAKLDIAKTIAQSLVAVSQFMGDDAKYNKKLILSILQQTKDVSFIAGGGVWPEPKMLNKSKVRDSYFFGRDENAKFIFFDDYNTKESKGYHNEEWYVPTITLKEHDYYWSKSYTDPFTSQAMITISVPIYRNGILFGISTVDLKFDALDRLLLEEADKLDGFAFIVDRNSQFISFPNENVMNEDKTSVFIKDYSDKHKYFSPIQKLIDKLQTQNLSVLTLEDMTYVENLVKDSYQINTSDAKNIASILLHPNKKVHKDAYINHFIKDSKEYMVIVKNLSSQWKVGLSISNDLMLQSRDELIAKIFVSMLFIMLFIGSLGYFYLKKSIVSPLIDVSSQLKDTDSEFPTLHVTANKELDILVTQFNQHTKLLEKNSYELKLAINSKSDFLAAMSHEIRTPITAIMGFITRLKDSETDNSRKEILNIVDNSTNSLLVVINDILDFSKIESGKLFMENIPFETKKLFEEEGLLFFEKAKEKNIKLHVEISDDIPECIIGDVVRIKQVLSNLLSNAIKFTDKDGHVDLNVEYIKSSNKIQCIIKDDGIGIAIDNQEKIFNPFTQEDGTTTRKYGGTGLGLSISKSLANEMCADLTLLSDGKTGTTFIFSLPVLIAEMKEEVQESTTDCATLDGNILLVEDNKTNQLLISMLLDDLGLSVEVANNGSEAVDMFKSKQYTLILMDENMPVMNGIEATSLILEFEKQQDIRHTPIVAITANALRGDRERFLEAGMDEYVSKPIDNVHFTNVLSSFLKC